MPRRDWNKLDPQTTYTFKSFQGWSFTLVDTQTVTLTHNGAVMSSGPGTIQLTVDPDPGSGNEVPPTEP